MSGCDWWRLAVVTWALAAGLAAGAGAQPASPHRGFLGGPWEVVAKMGHEGTVLRLPLSIRDESKPQELDGALPVMGTPITVKVTRYLPNLVWETTAVEDPNGGPAAKLSLRGGNLHQDLWLSGRDRERQSISAHIGGVAIREFPSARAADAALRKLTNPDTVGTLFLWLHEGDSPLIYVVQPGRSAALPGSDWKLTILRYVPHYSVDRATREVTSLSDKPVNPAIEVRVEGGGKEYRQWLWSQFTMSPHKIDTLPFRARFLDFDLGASAGQYILVMTPHRQAFVFHTEDGTRHFEPVEIGKRYPFSDESHSFAVEELRGGVIITNAWRNGSEVLLRPAVVAEIAQGSAMREVVLELNQPCHHKTGQGTLVLMYRRVP